MLIESLVIKAAFIVQSERMVYVNGGKFAPTTRVSVHLYPRLTVPKLSLAISEVAKDGTIVRPTILWRSR